jgi:hypothetical protein
MLAYALACSVCGDSTLMLIVLLESAGKALVINSKAKKDAVDGDKVIAYKIKIVITLLRKTD